MPGTLWRSGMRLRSPSAIWGWLRRALGATQLTRSCSPAILQEGASDQLPAVSRLALGDPHRPPVCTSGSLSLLLQPKLQGSEDKCDVLHVMPGTLGPAPG